MGLSPIKTYKIVVKGIVQGVGFRPFIYELALKYDLKGYVVNSSIGVEIYINSNEDRLFDLIKNIKSDAPILSHIVDINFAKIEHIKFDNFEIRKSKESIGITLVSPDTAICDDCNKELFDQNDRRYLYPFINCTNCGPRYSIIESIPYDRKSTTMKYFKMCEECFSEYNEPIDRRFHAQPNACDKCGPNVFYNELEGVDAIKEIAFQIDKGEIVAVKGLGGYHIICDANSDAAIKKLRKIKNRPTKPFAVMCFDSRVLKKHNLKLDKIEEDVFSSYVSPILILKWENNPLSNFINPINNKIGIMQAYTPLHRILFKYLETDFIVATSGNLSEEPICKDENEAIDKLSKFTKHFLHHNRDIHTRIDDSVVKILNSKPYVLRRARGFAPYPITLPFKTDTVVLGLGAHLKNTITLTFENYAFVSQYIGDLDNVETTDFFEEIINKMQNLLKINPEVVIIDLHPYYYSTKYAKNKGVKTFSLQHHHSHMLACMAENSLTDKLIGVVFDGTGLGDDNAIWGGEFFIKDKKIIRKYHLDYSIQPAMDTAAKKPYFMLISYLYKYDLLDKFSDILINRLSIELSEINLIKNIVENKINSIETSSMGRLFEAIGCLLSKKKQNEFEADTAILLESMVDNETEEFYQFEIEEDRVIFKNIINGIFEDITNNLSEKIIATKFQNTIAEIVISVCIILRDETLFNDVVLSGGVFQNIKLTEKIINKLEQSDFNVFVHSKVPANDSSISIGQVYSYILMENGLLD